VSRSKRLSLVALALVLLVTVGIIQEPLDFLRYDPASKSGLQPANIIDKDKKETSLLFDLSLQFIGAAAIGMREAVASLLWVRADEFFHSGEYEAILPLVRIVTWLDPHQLDVYSTGAWHLDYNFTDSEERSDRRYIPPAIALMREGIRNNPEIYDMYFDLGWMHYLQKIKDYDNAAYWIGEATKRDAKDIMTGKTMSRPGFVRRMYAHACEKSGNLDEAERQWELALAEMEKNLREKRENSFYTEVDVCKKNLGLMCLRKAWRYGDIAAYERGIKVLETLGNPDPRQEQATKAAKAELVKWKAIGKMPRDIDPPVDAKLEIKWKKIKSKVILVEGTANLLPSEYYKNLVSEPYTLWYQENQQLPPERQEKWRTGCKLRILLADYDYDYSKLSDQDRFDWEIDKTQTVLMDEVAIYNGKFSIKLDMSKDPDMYSFSKDKYKLVVWFNPQDAPDHIQDRIGWNGEGLTDAKYLDTKTRPGVKMLRAEFVLKKSDIL